LEENHHRKVAKSFVQIDATGGWREAMVGTPSLYDAQGDRLHTTYIGESPGYGKGTFKARYGVTEAACKTLVKQRLCNSGMRWKSQGAKIVLTLRGLVQSGNRWQQFWDKIDQYGLQKAVN
jgi:hypothetical protein